MMSAPEREAIPQINGPVQYSIPPSAPQPNTIPMNFQWNIHPGPAGSNVFLASPMWNVSPAAPQMISPTTAQQWNVQPAPPGYNVPSAVMPQHPGLSNYHQIFLKGKPKALGIVLIVAAILQIFFAIALPFTMFSATLFSGIQFWGPIFYIIAGSLSISAHKKPNVCRVKGSLALNIMSSIFSLTGIIINIVDFSIMDCEYSPNCHDNGGGGFTIISFHLILNLLVFCVSISISVFGCRAVEKVPSNATPVFVIQNDVVLSMPPSAFPTNSSVPQQPPPYIAQGEEKVKPAE